MKINDGINSAYNYNIPQHQSLELSLSLASSCSSHVDLVLIVIGKRFDNKRGGFSLLCHMAIGLSLIAAILLVPATQFTLHKLNHE